MRVVVNGENTTYLPVPAALLPDQRPLGLCSMKENYAEGAYETRGSRLKSGCGEQMIETELRLLEKIR